MMYWYMLVEAPGGWFAEVVRLKDCETVLTSKLCKKKDQAEWIALAWIHEKTKDMAA